MVDIWEILETVYRGLLGGRHTCVFSDSEVSVSAGRSCSRGRYWRSFLVCLEDSPLDEGEDDGVGSVSSGGWCRGQRDTLESIVLVDDDPGSRWNA